MAATTWPQLAVPVFPAGYAPAQADLTAWVTGSFGFASTGVVLRAIQQAAQSLTGGSPNTLEFGATTGDILEDLYHGWSHTATGSQPANSYLVPYTGWYEVTISACNQNTAMWAAAGVQVSGGTAESLSSIPTPSGNAGGACASLIIPATGGIDYIQAIALPSASVSTATSTGLLTSLEIAYVSSG
jgi:hypothetical protein